MRKLVVYSILLIGSGALILSILGLALSLSGKAGTQVKQQNQPTSSKDSTPVSAENSLFVLALGDSLTTGAGDEEGTGYVGHVTEGLQMSSERSVTLSNRAINGMKAEQLLAQIAEPEVQLLVNKADAILLSIGGNDLFRDGETLASLDEQLIASIEQQFEITLPKILTTLRTVNPEAPIAIIGLYNPFNQLDSGQLTNEIVRRWNERVTRILSDYNHSVLVPTYDLYDLNGELYLSEDRFHPNGSGYKQIGTRLLQALPQSLLGGASQ